ncbi:MAG: ABC transporter ATP-binding protein [bacterium]|nr:ABC transporter ATP-binding protein [bacterium]
MISAYNISKSFLLPHLRQRSVRGGLLGFFERTTHEVMEVVKDFSLEVSSGEFVGIMGPNGTGKSTLLKILAGVYQPDSGEVKVDGKLSAILELGVGFHPELSARENVELNGALLGLSSGQIHRQMKSVFEFAELTNFMDMSLKHFSSGMTARLAFSVAMQVQADVYLVDEVLAVGDQSFQEKCLKHFRQLKQEGKTVVLVSHSQALVNEICDRVITL